MSQKEVYNIIRELGGKASTSEIKKRAREKFPNLSLHLYVNNRLTQLEKYGFIRKHAAGRVTTWTIVEEVHYPDAGD